MDFSIYQIILAISAGFLAGLTPCILPILPIILLSSVQKNILAPLVLVVGLISSFTIFGVLLGQLSNLINVNQSYISSLGAYFLIFFGLLLVIPKFKGVFANFTGKIADFGTKLSEKHRDDSLKFQFILGCTLGIIWTPCSGPLLGATFSLLASDGVNAFMGGIIMMAFAIGTSLPMLAVAYGAHNIIRRNYQKIFNYQAIINKFIGIIFILFGLALILGWVKKLEKLLLDIIPLTWSVFTTSI